MGSLGSGLVGMFSGPAPRQLKTTACSVDGADQPLLSQIFYRFLQIFTDFYRFRILILFLFFKSRKSEFSIRNFCPIFAMFSPYISLNPAL